MATLPESVFQSLDNGNSPLELLMFGFSAEDSARYATALRNSGQAVRMESTDTSLGLSRLLETEPADLVTIRLDEEVAPAETAIGLIRDTNPSAAIVLVSSQPDAHFEFAIQHHAKDLLPLDSYQHFAFAIKREYEALLMRHELANARRQHETEHKRHQALLNDSRDAIAYVHEGIHIEANNAYCELFGLTKNDVEGLPIMDLIGTNARVDFKRALKQVSNKRDIRQTIHCQRTDGQEFDARMEFSSSEADGEICTRVVIRNTGIGSELQARINELKDTDPQTGLLNRHTFMNHLEEVLSSGQPPQTPALMLLSLDNYADICDTAGMIKGDCLLKETADLLNQQFDEKPLLARFGDHEFIIFHTTDILPKSIAQECLDSLKRARLEQCCELTIEPQFSIGLAIPHPETPTTAYELVRQCNQASRTAQSSTKEKIVTYPPSAPHKKEVEPVSTVDQGIVKLIDHALENDQFLLMYQPVISLDGDTREDYSIFVRLLDSSATKRDPVWFFEQARKTERMSEIDRWVVRRTISELARHRKADKKVNFHVQLSTEGALDDSMLLWICDCLREFKVKGAWLYFQFDFSLLQKKPAELDRFIGSLKKINCRITCNNVDCDAADYSALEHYKVDVVRFAPSATKDLSSDADRQDRLAELNSRIQGMGIKTVATGIEDANTLTLLWNVKVNQIQGYFLQEPSPSIDADRDRESPASGVVRRH